MPVPHQLSTAVSIGQTLLLALMPHGGQHTARRNAWSGMVDDAQRMRGRREAERAMDAAQAAADARAAGAAAAAR